MKVFIVLLISINSCLVFAQNTNARTKHFNLENGLAIEGYDPVAYFHQGKAIEGSSKLSANYLGVIYYFSSPKNKDLFLASPARYEPQYGGWCAYAMGSEGEKVSVNPETFKIVNGKLYLFYNAYFNNTLSSWNKNEASFKTKADNNWFTLNK